MKKIIFILLIGISVVGCKSKNIKTKIADNIENKCKGIDSCTATINMQEVTDFKWDKLYLFREGTSLEDINKALGFDYPYFEDIARRIIFVSGDKVVYHEDEFPYPNAKPIAGVIFQIDNDTITHYRFTLDNAIFNIKKTLVNGYKYYELTPIIAAH